MADNCKTTMILHPAWNRSVVLELGIITLETHGGVSLQKTPLDAVTRALKVVCAIVLSGRAVFSRPVSVPGYVSA